MFQSKTMKRANIVFVLAHILILIAAIIISATINLAMLKKQTDFNASIAGMLDKGITPSNQYLVQGEIDTDYLESGKEILKKYSYGTSNLSIFIDNKRIFLQDFALILAIVLLTYITTLFLFYKMYCKLMLKVEDITEGLEKDVISNVTVFESDEEMSIDLLKKNINALINRSAFNNQKLKNDMKLTQKLLTDISHQIKTPLSSLKMYNEIMISNEKLPTEDLQKFLHESNSQIDRIDWLIQGLLKLSRIEAKAVEMVLKDAYIYDTIQNAILPLKSLAREKDIEIILNCNQNISIIHDNNWVSEAIGNIVKNAIEHSYEHSTVEISCTETPLTVEISIKDYGIGVKEENLPKLFERFYHEQGAKPSGVGIGLPLAKEILAKNNAEVYVKSQYQQGSEFIITFLKKP